MGAGPGMETMLVDPVLESLGARRPIVESTAAANELGGGERLATTAANAMETTGAAEPLEAGVGAANIGVGGANGIP